MVIFLWSVNSAAMLFTHFKIPPVIRFASILSISIPLDNGFLSWKDLQARPKKLKINMIESDKRRNQS
jgi:hypothetical protein